MMTGQWRDGFPRMTLTLLGSREPLSLEFVVDTGFNGEIALPEYLIGRLGASPSGTRYLELAGGFRQPSLSYLLSLEWDGEERMVEVLALDGNPLIGNDLWNDQTLQAEMRMAAESSSSCFKRISTSRSIHRGTKQ